MRKYSDVIDVLIVGAGPAGLMLAAQLSKHPYKVSLVESGELNPTDETKSLNDVIHEEAEFKAATDGRRRGLGGTTQIWGGALIPVKGPDYLPHPLNWHNGWPFNGDLLKSYEELVYNFFAMPKVPNDTQQTSAKNGWINRTVNWPNFKARNAFTSYSKFSKSNHPKEIIGFTLVEIQNGSAFHTAVLKNIAGKTKIIRCKKIVVSTGAIETTRQALLLGIHRSRENGNDNEVTGKFLQDHFSTTIGKFSGKGVENLNADYGFQFAKFGMTSRRLETSRDHCLANNIPSGFVHLLRSGQDSEAFTALRKFMQSIQSRKWPNPVILMPLLSDPIFVVKFIWYYIKNRSIYRGAVVEIDVHYVYEQEPFLENSITLSETEVDALGVPKVVINWKFAKTDVKNIVNSVAGAEKILSAIAQKYGCTYKAKQNLNFLETEVRTYQVYHPVGTLSFCSVKGTNKVLNEKLELRGFPDIHFLSTAMFPTSTGANPTFTLLLFACYLADQIAQSLNSSKMKEHDDQRS